MAHTTKTGSILSIQQGNLHVLLPDGKTVDIQLNQTVQSPPAAVAALRKGGRDPKNYRTLAHLNLEVEAADWVDAQYEIYRAAVEAERNRAAEALRRNVPGLDELTAAIRDEIRQQQEFERMMDDEYNDGARPPKPVKVASADVAATYPVAAAYLKAEGWGHASHYVKAAAGNKAKARIAAGESYTTVLADMEAEWSAHCEQHAWD